MTDEMIIEAASDAGLCFPECWNLRVTSEDDADDLAWIQDGYRVAEKLGREREEIFTRQRKQRETRMAELRRFAELVIERSGSAG